MYVDDRGVCVIVVRDVQRIICIGDIVIGGVDTTIPLFQKLLQEPDILSGDYDIHWLEKWAARQKGDA